MNILDITLAADKAIKRLEESGKVAKTVVQRRDTEPIEVNTQYNEEMGFASAQVEGTLGLKDTDLSVMFVIYQSNGSFIDIPTADGKKGYQQVTSPLLYGNLGLVGMGDDNGFPCAIVVDFEQNASLVVWASPATFTLGATAKYEETIHPIDPKFIPPLDSLTLNGADGKQCKLSVDESGQLVTAVVE